eukprot:2920-Heterococcus_DN1.PRE.1
MTIVMRLLWHAQLFPAGRRESAYHSCKLHNHMIRSSTNIQLVSVLARSPYATAVQLKLSVASSFLKGTGFANDKWIALGQTPPTLGSVQSSNIVSTNASALDQATNKSTGCAGNKYFQARPSKK